jgi:hypothetical protein
MHPAEAKLILKADEARLEEITSAFVRGLLMAGRFEDKTKYLELASRLASIMDAEIDGWDDDSLRKLWMTAWGHRAN